MYCKIESRSELVHAGLLHKPSFLINIHILSGSMDIYMCSWSEFPACFFFYFEVKYMYMYMDMYVGMYYR